MAKKKSTTKKTANTKKAVKKTVTKAAKKVTKKAPAKAARKAATKAAKKPAKKKSAKAKTEKPSPAEVDVAVIAYQIYLERVEKGLPGDQYSDWAAAERRVRKMV